MKTKFSRQTLWPLTAPALVFGLVLCLKAQDTNIDWNMASDDQVILQAIEQTTPTPSNAVPAFATFYSAQHSPISAEPWPPLPGNAESFDAWDLGSNVWLLDDLGFDYDPAAAQTGQSMMAMDDSGLLPPGSGGTNPLSPAGSPIPFDPGTNLWIAQEAISRGKFFRHHLKHYWRRGIPAALCKFTQPPRAMDTRWLNCWHGWDQLDPMELAI